MKNAHREPTCSAAYLTALLFLACSGDPLPAMDSTKAIDPAPEVLTKETSGPAGATNPSSAHPVGGSREQFGFLPADLPLDKISSGLLMMLDRGGDLVQWSSGKGTVPPASKQCTDPSIVAGLDPRVGLNLQLGPDPAPLPTNQVGQVEPHIVRDPANPDVLVAVFQEGRFAPPITMALDCGYSVSRDGGLSWSRALVPGLTQLTGGPYFVASDPVAGIDLAGNIYINNLVGWSSNPPLAAVVLSRCTNGGATFDPPVEIFRSTSSSLRCDKNWMAINTFAQTPTAGRIVVTWTMLGSSSSVHPLVRSYSDDAGRTWSPYAYITPTAFACQGSQPVFLSDGTLAVVYLNYNSSLTSGQAMELVISTDGGVSFGTPRLVTPVLQYQAPGIRTMSIPSAVADRSNGVLYVTYQTVYLGAPRIMFTKSADQGVTWTTPVPISDNPASAPVFNPAIAVSPDGQVVTVEFYDQRVNLSQTNLVDIFVAQSLDGGSTWQPNLRLTTVSSDVRLAPLSSSGYMLGDYQGIAAPSAPDLPAVPVWIDTRTGNPDPFTTRVGVASQVTFSAWRAARFSLGQIGNPHISGPGADPDADGVVNTLEYAFGLNPWQSDAPEFSFQFSGSGPSAFFSTSYERLSTASDLTYDWLASADLTTWSAAISTNVVITPNPPRLTETVTSSFDPGTNASQFYRLTVRLNE